MLLLLAIIGLVSATCYLPNGTADSAPYIAQCPSSFRSQMCCWLVNLPNPDNCTTQGICLSNYNSDESRTYVDACTDPGWGSGCSPFGKLCPSNPAGYVEVTTCSDGSVCCGHSDLACCNDGRGYKIDAEPQLQESQVTPTAESSPTAELSPTAEFSTTASSTPSIRPLPSQNSANNQSDSSNSLALPTVAVVIALLAWYLPMRTEMG